MRRNLFSIFSLGLALLFVDAAYAELLEAVDDNCIRGGLDQADSVQHCWGDLPVKKSVNIEFARKAYVKFDLNGHNPNGSQPATFTIRKADLPDADFTVNVYGLLAGFIPDAGELGTDWSKTLLTWNNAPANVDTITGFDSTEASWIGTIAPQRSDAVGTSYSVDLPTLDTYLQSDNTVTMFLIVDSQTNTSPSMLFASSEHADLAGPELHFVPEPATLTLLLFLPVAWAVYSRRRKTG